MQNRSVTPAPQPKPATQAPSAKTPGPTPSPTSRRVVVAFLLGEKPPGYIASALRAYFSAEEVENLMESYRKQLPLGRTIADADGRLARDKTPEQIIRDPRFNRLPKPVANAQAPSRFAIRPVGISGTVIVGSRVQYEVVRRQNSVAPAYAAEVSSPPWLRPFVRTKASYQFFWFIQRENRSRQIKVGSESTTFDWSPEETGQYQIICRVEERLEDKWHPIEEISFSQEVRTTTGAADEKFGELPKPALDDVLARTDSVHNAAPLAPSGKSAIEPAVPGLIGLAGRYVSQTFRIAVTNSKKQKKLTAQPHAWFVVPTGEARKQLTSKRYQAWPRTVIPSGFGKLSGKGAFDLGIGAQASFHFGDIGDYRIVAAPLSTEGTFIAQPQRTQKWVYKQTLQRVISQEAVRVGELAKPSFRLLPQAEIAFTAPRAPLPLMDESNQPYYLQVEKRIGSARANRFAWFILCEDWTLMAQNNEGFYKVAIPQGYGIFSGQPAYEIPPGSPTLQNDTRLIWPFRQANRYTVLCVELDEQNRPQTDQAGNLYRFSTKSVQLFRSDDLRGVALHQDRIRYAQELDAVRFLMAKLDPKTITPIKAYHIDEKGSAKEPLQLYYGKYKNPSFSPGVLVDRTHNHARREYEGATIQESLQLLCDRLAEGLLRVEYRDVDGKLITRDLRTTNRFAKQIEALNSFGTVAATAAIASSLFLPAAVPVLLGLLAATATATSGYLQYQEHLNEFELDGAKIAMDISLILSAVVAVDAMRTGGLLRAGLKAMHIKGQTAYYFMIAIDGGRSILIAAEAYDQIQTIQNSPHLSPVEKERMIRQILSNATLWGGMVAVRYMIPPLAARLRHERAQAARPKPSTSLAIPRPAPNGQTIETYYNAATKTWEPILPIGRAPAPASGRPSSNSAVPVRQTPQLPASAQPPAPLALPPGPAVPMQPSPIHLPGQNVPAEPETVWPRELAPSMPEPVAPTVPAGPLWVHPNLVHQQNSIVKQAKAIDDFRKGRRGGFDDPTVVAESEANERLAVLKARFDMIALIRQGKPIPQELVLTAGVDERGGGIDPSQYGYWQPAQGPDGKVPDWQYNSNLALAQNQHYVILRQNTISNALVQSDRELRQLSRTIANLNQELKTVARQNPVDHNQLLDLESQRDQAQREHDSIRSDQVKLHAEQNRLTSWLKTTPLPADRYALREQTQIELWRTDLRAMVTNYRNAEFDHTTLGGLQNLAAHNAPYAYQWVVGQQMRPLRSPEFAPTEQLRSDFLAALDRIDQQAQFIMRDSVTNRGHRIVAEAWVRVRPLSKEISAQAPGLARTLAGRMELSMLMRRVYERDLRVSLTENPSNGQIEATIVVTRQDQ